MFKKIHPIVKKILVRGAFAIFICFVAVVIINVIIKKQTNSNLYNNVTSVPPKTFAIVLGAGISQTGKPSSYLQLRLNDAIQLYQAKKIQKILLTGDNSRSNYNEIGVMYNYLVAHGVPPKIIYGDFAGFDTYNSFERASSIFNIKDAIIVSQQFHIPRCLYIAQQKNITAVAFASNTNFGSNTYLLRESLATAKSVIDCLLNRKAKFYGNTVNTNLPSNITAENSTFNMLK
jgi:SanA protein